MIAFSRTASTRCPVKGMMNARLALALILLLPALPAFAASGGDVVFRHGFEGLANPGTISGHVYFDSDHDGDLSGEDPRSGVQIYLDLNFNGILDDDDWVTESAADGFYQFLNLPQGLYHVRQALTPPAVQTFPEGGITPVTDGLPDEVVDYVHAPAGTGDFDVPYGKLAWPFPPDWPQISTRPLPEPIDSVDLVLQPIGVRNKLTAGRVTRGVEVLTMPDTARLTVRFDEVVFDGPGPDLLIHTLDAQTDEAFEVLVGPTEFTQVSMGIYAEEITGVYLDLSDIAYQGPVHYVTLVAVGNGGAWAGAEVAGLEALSIAAPAPGTHVVNITQTELIFEDRDFGRYSQDLPPSLALGVTDNDPETPEVLAGESVTVQLTATDDVAIATTTLQVNGALVPLDSGLSAVVPTTMAGELLIEAEAIDSAGQSVQRDAVLYVLNADGSDPFSPNSTGSSNAGEGAPAVKIVTPAPGTVSSDDLPITASVLGPPTPVTWQLEIAPVADIDPYALEVDDPDYQQLAAGSGNVFSEVIGTAPMSTLADGIYFLRLTAQGATGPPAHFGQVIARNVSEADLRPQISISSPSNDDHVSVAVDILGSIMSVQPLLDWFVDVAPAAEINLNNLGADNANWRRIGQGSDTVDVEAVLASFDATMLRNGRYVVRVMARNTIGMGWVEPLLLEVTGEKKLGRNRVVFEDIAINLAGFPLRLERIYDSIEANKSGDFGFGWSLGMQDPDLRETVPDTGVLGLFGATPLRVGTRVYVNAPTGERLGFTFNPELGPPSPLGQPYRVVFTPDPGTYYRLEVPQGDAPFITIRADGEAFLFPIALPYNPEQYILVSREGIRYTIHEDKGLLAAEDLNGNTLSFNPDGVEHSSGMRLTYVRDGADRITDIIDPEGNTWSYSYDAQGNLDSHTDADGITETYSYHASPVHFLDTITDPQGRSFRSYEYDPVTGRLIAVIDENGNRRESLVDTAAFDGVTMDARGNTTYSQFDARGNIVFEEDPLGNTMTFEYADPANPDLRTRVTDQLGESWIYEYNNLGLPTRLSTPLASGLSQQRFDMEYDALGNLTRFEDNDGNVSVYTYDSIGNRLSEVPFDGLEFTFEYGPEGRLSRRRLGDDFVVEYGYDAFGFVNHQSNSYGYESNMTNSASGRMIQRDDDNGNLSVSFSPHGLVNTQTDDDGNTATLTRNSDESLTRTDRNGNVSQVDFDADGRPVSLGLPEGGNVATQFDADGNPASITDPLGYGRTYAFDALNRPGSFTDSRGNARSATYDPAGNVVETIDRNGKRRTFEWDANRRMTRELWHDGGGAVVREIVFTYSAATGLQQIDDSDMTAGETYTLVYSGALPRPSRVTYVLPGQEDWQIRYTWNNEIHTPADIRVNLGASTRARIQVQPYAGQVWGLRWLHPGSSGVDNSVELRRTSTGRLERVQRETGANGGNAVAVTHFSYDNLGRVAQIRHEDDGGALLHGNGDLGYSWDPEGRLLSEVNAGNTASYSYDGNGQILSAMHSDPAYPDESYTYDLGGNRLTSHTAPGAATFAAANELTASGDFTFDYDDAGNLVRRTDTVTGSVIELAYDHRNRLIRASTHASLGAPADDLLEFGYDYQNRLLFRIVNGVRTWVLHDHQQPVAEFSEGANVLSASYLYDPAKLDAVYAAWRDDALGERWYLHDQLGSVRGVTDAAFVVQAWLDYDSYGNLQPGSMLPAGETLGFAARPWVPELGLYDNRRRFYDSAHGRFTQEDPLGFRGRDYNLYRYALNNPTRVTDPTGETAAIDEAVFFEAVMTVSSTIAGALNNEVGLPCHVAHWSALTFGWFGSVAELVGDPVNAPLTIEREDLLSLTGCNSIEPRTRRRAPAGLDLGPWAEGGEPLGVASENLRAGAGNGSTDRSSGRPSVLTGGIVIFLETDDEP